MEDVKKACAGAVQYCTEQGVDITRLAVHYTQSTMIDEVRTCTDYRTPGCSLLQFLYM